MKTNQGNVSIIVSVIITILLVVLVVYGLMHTKTQAPVIDQQIVDTTVQDSVAHNTETTQTTNKSMEPNTQAAVAKNGDTLLMNYTGRLTNGTVFDSNVDPKFHHVEPFEFKLGAGQVIQGWDEGLVGMKVGEKKTLTIPPEKGYGARGAGAAIPPNATLIFDVELVGIK